MFGQPKNRLYTSKEPGSVCNYYLKTILESGLMLDEDLELVLDSCLVKADNFDKVEAYITIATCTMSTVGCAIIARYYYNPLLVPCILFFVPTMYTTLEHLVSRNYYRNNISLLVDHINEMYRLNSDIIRYLKTRSDVKKAKDTEIFPVVADKVQSLMLVLSQQGNEVLEVIAKHLWHLHKFLNTSYYDELPYNGLDKFDPFKADIEECICYAQKLKDILILFISKFLCYLALSLASSSNTVQDLDNRIVVLYELVPKQIKSLNTSYVIIKKTFDTTRFSTTQVKENLNHLKKIQNERINLKLKQALSTSVTNISIILEKASNILVEAERSDERDLEGLGNSILDLRDQTFATFESLDVLYKLHGIISNNQLKTTQLMYSKSIEPAREYQRSKTITTVNYNDNNEPSEDLKFELYVGDDDDIDALPQNRYEDDQPAPYLSLMLQDLKQSLKQHQRFVDARKRRGSDPNEDVDEKNTVTVERVSKFKLEDLKNPPLAPPPPPPLFYNSDDSRNTVKGMLDSIVALSAQRSATEDVFGDSGDDSDSSPLS